MLEGIGSLASLFQVSKNLWQSALALTDIYGLYGLVDFYTKSKWFEIKPLLGVEIPFVPHCDTHQFQKWISHPSTITILVQSPEGYHNLLRLVSAGYTFAKDELPFVDFALLKQFSQWLLILIGWLNSYAHQLCKDHDSEQLQQFIENCIASFGKDNCIIDITAQSYKSYPFLQQANDMLLQLAQELGLFTVTSSGYLYPEASQKTAYETALAIKDGRRVYDPEARKIAWEHHILSEWEIRALLKNNGFSDELIDQLVHATGELADRCVTKITLGQALFPNFETPVDVQSLYEENRVSLVE